MLRQASFKRLLARLLAVEQFSTGISAGTPRSAILFKQSGLSAVLEGHHPALSP
jgi:hypothetical protein